MDVLCDSHEFRGILSALWNLLRENVLLFWMIMWTWVTLLASVLVQEPTTRRMPVIVLTLDLTIVPSDACSKQADHLFPTGFLRFLNWLFEEMQLHLGSGFLSVFLFGCFCEA